MDNPIYVPCTADIWSTKHRNYMGVFLHCINAATLEQESGMLGCFRFCGSHTFDKVAKKLDAIQREFGISERKIVATVTDNGSNFLKAFKEFRICPTKVSSLGIAF